MFEDFANTFNLGDFLKDNMISEDEILSAKKKLSHLLKETREITKQETCYYCGKIFSSFCNSHSLPAFVLRNIATDGMVYTPNAFINHPALKIDKGVNQAGTFNLICRDCDSKIFSEYENPDNYMEKPTQIMLAQMALKNNLMYIGKRKFEINLYEKSEKELGMSPGLKESFDRANNLDLNEYIEAYKKAKKAMKKSYGNEYYLCYYERLNYVVPLAFQGQIALVSDFKGDTINDIFNTSPSYKIKNINIGVFPLENETVVFMFIENEEKRYRNFYKQFNSLEKEDRLLALTYILLSYSEEVYYSKELHDEILKNKELQRISSMTPNILSPLPFVDALQVCKENYNLSKRDSIPNLLSEDYKIR